MIMTCNFDFEIVSKFDFVHSLKASSQASSSTPDFLPDFLNVGNSPQLGKSLSA